MGRFSFPPSEGNAEEQSWLAKLNAEEIDLNARLKYFGLSSSNASSQQIKGYIDELNSFLGRFRAWRPSAAKLKLEGHGAFSQKLEGLIERIQYNLQTYNFTYSSRSAFERFQHQQASAPWPGAPAARRSSSPHRGISVSPRRRAAPSCSWRNRRRAGPGE